MQAHTVGDLNIVGLIKMCIEQLAATSRLAKLDKIYKEKYTDSFPTDIPHVCDLPTDVYHHIDVKPGVPISTARAYSCPRKYCEGWKTLIDQHYAAGRIRPFSSQYTSPSFIIPKVDPTVLPCWVNDYRNLNRATVPDNYPLPRINDILADCTKGKIWGKIDMTNSFFQTLVHPDHIKYTATLTPFGLWEWVVMPMGLQISPATHQRCVTMALKNLIGCICHVYLDDIIIWSQTLAEHEQNVSLVLKALQKAQLYCSPKKSSLFNTELNFLGHTISQRGIEADNSKVSRILEWPTPTSTKEVRCFLGLVRYISAFLPALAEHTVLLMPLTHKECNTVFPAWTAELHHAFEAIKALVVSRDCLTTIDHHNPGDNKIFVTCDASQRCTGAVISFGPTWETARLVAFKS
jgi:Reverse transcriptase (RNA-dependent DNA polymerase)